MDLKERYIKEVVPALMTKFNYKSVMQVPKLEKIVRRWKKWTRINKKYVGCCEKNRK